MRGRPPAPKVLNDLKGDTHKRRRNEQEAEAPKGKPTCPRYLDAIAKQEWKVQTTNLEAMGLLTLADKTALETYCVAYSLMRQAEKRMAEDGHTQVTPNGFEQQSSWVGIYFKAEAIVRKWLGEFGGTPVARARIRQPLAPNKQTTAVSKFTSPHEDRLDEYKHLEG